MNSGRIKVLDPPFKLRWLAALGLVSVAAAVLFWFNPASSSFYPVCLFYQSTGWQCPGCGSLRAIHQLLHGHFAVAFHHNPLLVSVLPVVGYLAFTFGLATLRRRPWPRLVRPIHIWSMFAILIIFGIWRNLQ